MKTISIISTMVVFIGLLLVSAYFFPWRQVHWGHMGVAPQNTITVVGYAESSESNQVATFSAGVSSTGEDRQAAIAEVNSTIAELTQTIKDFGIADEDIKTQSVSAFQTQDPLINPIEGTTDSADFWTANNTIEVVIKDVNRVNEFADLLAASEVTDFWGPNFTVGDSSRDVQAELLSVAIENARLKAVSALGSSGKNVGDIVNIVEGSAGGGYFPMMESRAMMDGAGGASLQPGTTSIGQSVTVTFEIN